MKKLIFTALCIIATLSATAKNICTVIVNPGENTSSSVRINWHSDLNSGIGLCRYTPAIETDWNNAIEVKAWQENCTAFDSIYSRTAQGEDFYERAHFIRNSVEINSLIPDTKYKYCIDGDTTVRYFRTAPASGGWTAAVIADFHAYTPLPKRVESAMAMLDTLEMRNGDEFNMILHVGDITAWGGSYSFWKDLYSNKQFSNYTWAGVIGNHDHMSRGYIKNSNDYFRYVNNNPNNGYGNERGVCYHFTYGDALFIMLNSEAMRSDEGLADAHQWLREVTKNNTAKYIIVIEHYQWFFADGKTSQYSRWKDVFEECGVDLAIGANSHVYARTNTLYNGKETDGSKGTVYYQLTSSDNERGVEYKELVENSDIIKYHWTEGANTVSAVLLKADNHTLTLTLYDRNGNPIDQVSVKAKR